MAVAPSSSFCCLFVLVGHACTLLSLPLPLLVIVADVDIDKVAALDALAAGDRDGEGVVGAVADDTDANMEARGEGGTDGVDEVVDGVMDAVADGVTLGVGDGACHCTNPA
jgi:hypothetical protein